MARARNIKPGFFKNEVLAELEIETRLLFVGLWTLADREGRVEDRPKRIKMELFPCDSFDVDVCLSELAASGFIERYESNGVRVVSIVNFLKHQTPHGTEKDSELPDKSGSLTVHERDDGGYVSGKKRGNNVKKAPNNDDPLLHNSAKTVNPPLDNTLNPDSLNPDSLNPESKRERVTRSAPKPDDVDQQVWDDWTALRKAKKAPVTLTVVDGARTEAGKAGMPLEAFLRVWCSRGSQGMQADWLKPHERVVRTIDEPSWRREERERIRQAAPGIAAKQSTDFFDVEARNVTAIALGR